MGNKLCETIYILALAYIKTVLQQRKQAIGR